MVFLKLGDVEIVDLRSAKMPTLQYPVGLEEGKGTLKVETIRVCKMTAKTPNPQADRLTGEADEDLSRDSSILVAATINGNQCHKEICRFLIPRTTGWENFFLREILELRSLSATQREKLNQIASRYEQERDTRRICRYCQGLAQNIDEFSYFCRNCGNCLNLDWCEGGAR